MTTDLTWRKSSLSADNGTCVEVATLPDGLIAVRDSKNPAGGHLVIGKDLLLAIVNR